MCMKTIPLTQGQVALVDEGDFDSLNRFNWCAVWNSRSKTFYAVRHPSRTLSRIDE